MSFRAVLAGLAVGLVAAAIFFLPGKPPEAPPPAAQAAPADESPDAGVEIVAARGEPDASLPFDVDTLADGFCGPAGSESVRLRFTLRQLAAKAAEQALHASDAGEVSPEQHLLTRYAFDRPPAELLAEAKAASAAAPDSPWPYVVWALAAHELDQPDEQLTALRQARKLLPDDPAIAVALADATRESPELTEAIDGLATYLKAAPAPELARLRARLVVQRDIQRDYLRQERGGLTLLWPREVLTARQADDLLASVDRNLDDAAALTGTRRRERLTVVVYPSRSELLAVSCVRAWTAALYDGTLRVVAQPTEAGVDLKVVRHETLHAQLSPLAPQAPRWFHEGLAQSFAKEKEPRAAWAAMVRNRTWVPFRSLDASFQEFSSNDDAGLAYAQSYAMVELMRQLGTDAAVSTALAAFRSGADTPAALARACGRSEVTGGDLLEFLRRRLQPAGR